MRFGVSFLPDSSPETKSPVDYYREVFDLCRLADESGLDYVKMTEHYLHAYGGYCPSPLTFLAAVAAQTRQIRLITGCTLPVFHHPVKLASYIAMVDAISNGRLEVGFARAYLPHEFQTFQVPMDGSRQRFEATIDAVHRLLTEEQVTEDTPYFSFKDATVLPRPTQSPRPPFWVAAVQTPESFERIGRFGHGLLITPTGREFDTSLTARYREAFAAHHPDGTPRVMASMPLVVAETDQKARELADPHLNEYLKVWASALDTWDETVSTDYAQYTGLGSVVRTMTAKDLRATGTAFVGSPEHVADQIGHFQDRVGADGILWQVDFGGFGGTDAMRSMELFAEQVRPQFTAGTTPAEPAGATA
ncbi:alkanesulfonate monooxygenase SsuD/methylene tetrahydromethanopterin reductase-like flavin-dependent oxidoreductase (luciferase family) [Kitasatospora gansuensis]|uniref:Alkanesulfonate monooxygenase SsuD/methylene tetrahydromethanopterin reductase-like flavin-dependent oxidoreductase (Luciferase family) n=1 Tax=Kitasatospora gansuensis TaxID=258050 RepID=A0A7W7SIQ0_9ACTN|nr:LLM class flavin-dependent oxidoreductase [Kitasatospora gansuensis]MBB4951186.1 alkanesulfonate monooxygenase SsuD/methylene tetrahydromethanopterin reductase-like flavin-dependent oxidoreductase (luciferase family) [Kitasatospora gansuensis]